MNHKLKFNYLSHLMEEKTLKDLSYLWKSYHPQQLKKYQLAQPNSTIRVEYITCYSEHYFYLFIKTDPYNLVARDRAYQNGDGFHFVLTVPKNEDEKPTDEFYVIGISPLAKNQQKKFIWYHNIDLSFLPLRETRVDYIEKDNHNYFMVQIPWEEITPLQPFLYDKVGFNLSYVQAVSTGVNIYMLKKDDFIQEEQSKREYLTHTYEKPYPTRRTEWSIDLSSLHYHSNQKIVLKLAANGSSSTTISEINVQINQNTLMSKTLKLQAGLNRWHITLDLSELSKGTYTLEVKVQFAKERINKSFQLTIYDLKELEEIATAIESLKKEKTWDKKILESISTLEFNYQQIKRALHILKPYEPFSKINMMIKKLTNDIVKLSSKEHLFPTGKVLRRGIRSRLDDSLQPYSLYIPQNVNKEKKVGLIVFLHGSGSDDRNVIHRHQITLAEESKMIVVAPFGRGTSHGYGPKIAMDDIIEVTQKIMEIFTVDNTKIFLGGFSMGGYGTLRIYDYQPKLFRGLIIISGHYNLSSSLNDMEMINYSSPEKIKIFKNIPMIFFHGKRDFNLSYQENARFFEKLKKVNPLLEVHIAEDLGHSGLTEDWLKILLHWLKKYQ